MEFRRLDLEGLLEIAPKQIVDDRGYFSEVFRSDKFEKEVGPVSFVQDNQSLSVKLGTIRGLHFQCNPIAQAKLVRCLTGRLFDVAIDLRTKSPTFGQWTSIVLSPEDNNQLWLPVGFGHGFCTLEPNTTISYRVTNYYSPEHDKGVAWNDPDIGIDWPALADPETLSPKDRNLPFLSELPDYFLMEHA